MYPIKSHMWALGRVERTQTIFVPHGSREFVPERPLGILLILYERSTRYNVPNFPQAYLASKQDNTSLPANRQP